MSIPHQPEDVAAFNDSSLKTLVRAIELSQGQFYLILARCNYAALREQIVPRLRQLCPVEIQKLLLPESFDNLYHTIKAQLAEQQPPALMVFGLESVSNLDRVLTSTNYIREEFKNNFRFPLILWLNDQVLQKMLRLAPDFESWTTSIEFLIATDELIEFLQQEADSIFSTVLNVGEDRFWDNASIYKKRGVSQRLELELAKQDLQRRGAWKPILAASEQFILGRDAYAHNQMEQSRKLYEQSLVFWIQSNDLERQACLLFHLGLWWRRYAILHRGSAQKAYGRAREYYQQCRTILQRANRPDLEAKFINSVAEVLQQLQQWDELNIIAKTAVKLHQTYPNKIRLARAYGFLAEVALAKSRWRQVKQYAQTALETNAEASTSSLIVSITDLPLQSQNNDFVWARQIHQSWYRFLLAKAQAGAGKIQKAIQHLETAKDEFKPEYHPQLYLRILDSLRQLYFEQSQYLKAFQSKRQQRSIEQQYGFIAFIGAFRLRSQRQVINPALISVDSEQLHAHPEESNLSKVTMAQEIISSGRQQDVERLIMRLNRSDHKLIVIHGPSGVGKSSLLTAGLVPALHQQIAIDSRNPLPVVVRSYIDWVRQLGIALEKALGEIEKGSYTAFHFANQSLPTTPDSLEIIVEQLKKNGGRNLLTVLIFDQFEEFFFNCPNPAQRRKFWDFFKTCLDSLNVPYVKIILSLREDYLHHLLECDYPRCSTSNNSDTLTNLEVATNDILNKEVRYAVGDFSPSDAKQVIQSLTQRSFYLEPALIDELVRDLAGDFGKVRPIELQVVGAQLQAEKIATLAQYQESGPKEKLVQRFLKEVVKDCGPENEPIAELLLYLLTDENNTRPPKTHAELAAALETKANKLDLVLEILVKSGLVFVLPQFPADRYQLVHDYLVSFIRQQRGAELIAELEREKQQRQLAEAKLTMVLQQRLRLAYVAAFGLATLATVSVGLCLTAINQTNANLSELTTSSKLLLASDQQFDALFKSLQAARHLKQKIWANWVQDDTKARVVSTLRQAVYEVREKNRLQKHNQPVNSVSFSPDGQIIASASNDGIIKLWNPQGKELQSFRENNQPINSVSFSPNGQTIASASNDKTVKLWNFQGKPLQTFKGHQDVVNSISFSPNGQIIASASNDNTVKLWNLQGKLLQNFEEHGNWVNSVSFSPDGKIIASASNDGTIKFWNLQGEQLRELKLTGKITIVKFSPNGQRIASVSNDENNKDYTIKIWDLEGKKIQNIKEFKTIKSHSSWITSLSFSPDNKKIVSASNDNTVQVSNLENEKKQTLKGHSNRVASVSFSPDGHTIASASVDTTVKLWNLESKKPGNLKARIVKGDSSSARVTSVSFSPDRQLFVSANDRNKVTLYKVTLWSTNGSKAKIFNIQDYHTAIINSVNFSPDGQRIAIASEDTSMKPGNILNTEYVVKLYNLEGRLLNLLKGHSAPVKSLSFSPDSKIIAAVSLDKTVRLWSQEGELLPTLSNLSSNYVSFSPDSSKIVSVDADNRLQIRTIEGNLFQSLPGHTDSVTSVSFSPDGNKIASGSKDSTVRLWNLNQGKLFKTLGEHSKQVNSVSFSHNGKLIASASDDQTIKIWSHNGKELRTLFGHEARVLSVNFTPNDKQLVSADSEGKVIVWDLDLDYPELDELLKRSCDWVDDYLDYNPNVTPEDLQLCNYPKGVARNDHKNVKT
ncbi:MAG: hypothetical protein F6K36_14020 [Symploca sp. SIO3C6]|nr:hypothetical protein [Symploca sp. SIO3C6]